MFQLREDHASAFKDASLANFEDRGVRHLRKVLPDATAPYSDDQLRRRIRECIDRAAKYGLTTERQIMYFADSTFIADEHFDTAPDGMRARDVLLDRELAGDEKALLTLAAARGMANNRARVV
jgi:hypothetical protein